MQNKHYWISQDSTFASRRNPTQIILNDKLYYISFHVKIVPHCYYQKTVSPVLSWIFFFTLALFSGGLSLCNGKDGNENFRHTWSSAQTGLNNKCTGPHNRSPDVVQFWMWFDQTLWDSLSPSLCISCSYSGPRPYRCHIIRVFP